jgi:hypothetical protein
MPIPGWIEGPEGAAQRLGVAPVGYGDVGVVTGVTNAELLSGDDGPLDDIQRARMSRGPASRWCHNGTLLSRRTRPASPGACAAAARRADLVGVGWFAPQGCRAAQQFARAEADAAGGGDGAVRV